MEAIGIVLVSIICITIFGTFFHSIMSRRAEGVTRRIYQARMNIHMGLMFLSIAILQLTIPGSSWLRYTFIFLIFAVGLINLYYGVKHRRYFRQLVETQDEVTQQT
ncbi:YtpI family protein [Lihuaxuella thermophila]|uniref:YtpI-like protein n=1 Tax=Lihuaxuella thermophila TaxID=1173111 RepID=A0A1H8CPM7_9BACL|nr:YtpI family protein [Lihuaxuella thermophila]SEM96926.1 YtpI-like protein [Lihuaxuella thermophila]